MKPNQTMLISSMEIFAYKYLNMHSMFKILKTFHACCDGYILCFCISFLLLAKTDEEFQP